MPAMQAGNLFVNPGQAALLCAVPAFVSRWSWGQMKFSTQEKGEGSHAVGKEMK